MVKLQTGGNEWWWWCWEIKLDQINTIYSNWRVQTHFLRFNKLFFHFKWHISYYSLNFRKRFALSLFDNISLCDFFWFPSIQTFQRLQDFLIRHLVAIYNILNVVIIIKKTLGFVDFKTRFLFIIIILWCKVSLHPSFCFNSCLF